VTTKHHTTSRKSGGENSLYRAVWQMEHATCLQSVCWIFLCVCLDYHKISNSALIILGTLIPREMNWTHVQRRATTLQIGNSICRMLPFLNSHSAVRRF
jgi:hypothetical protein